MSLPATVDLHSAHPGALSLAGETAVITGASSGIGRAIAVELAARGASLCLLGRRTETLEGLSLPLAGTAKKRVYGCDLQVREQIAGAAQKLARDGAEPTILVHSAGVIQLGGCEDAALEDFDRQLEVNVRAPYALTQALLPGLKRRRGQIVFINSSAGMSAAPQAGAYSAAKHALRGFADSLRAEVNGIVRVTSVFTGNTATPMQQALHAAKGRLYDPESLIQPEDVAAVVGNILSLPRTVEVTSVHLRPAQPPA